MKAPSKKEGSQREQSRKRKTFQLSPGQNEGGGSMKAGSLVDHGELYEWVSDGRFHVLTKRGDRLL
jgi:hypothetical protein